MIVYQEKRYYSTQDIANVIGKSSHTIASYVRRNKIRAVKINNKWHITRKEFARFCKGQTFFVPKTKEELESEPKNWPVPSYWIRPGHLCPGLLSQGNSLTISEWRNFLRKYTRARKSKGIDSNIIPFLDRINSSGIIMTLSSCCCGETDSGRPIPHVLFRSCLNPSETIEKVLQPIFRNKEIYCDIKLELDASDVFGLVYIFRFPRRVWRLSLAKVEKILKSLKIQRYKSKNKSFKEWMNK